MSLNSSERLPQPKAEWEFNERREHWLAQMSALRPTDPVAEIVSLQEPLIILRPDPSRKRRKEAEDLCIGSLFCFCLLPLTLFLGMPCAVLCGSNDKYEKYASDRCLTLTEDAIIYELKSGATVESTYRIGCPVADEVYTKAVSICILLNDDEFELSVIDVRPVSCCQKPDNGTVTLHISVGGKSIAVMEHLNPKEVHAFLKAVEEQEKRGRMLDMDEDVRNAHRNANEFLATTVEYSFSPGYFPPHPHHQVSRLTMS